MKLKLKALLLAASCAVIASCASPADSAAMVPTDLNTTRQFSKTVGLGVNGGQKTNPLWTSMVSDEDFSSALQSSIEQRKLFSRVLSSGSGDYQLDVRLIQLHQPFVGLNMTVTADIDWKLREKSSGRVVWQKITNKSYTATVGDAVAGIKRLRLANEGAIRESIKAALQDISRLSL